MTIVEATRMEQWERKPEAIPTSTADQGFAVKLGVLLAGVALLYVFRPQVEHLAAHPNEVGRWAGEATQAVQGVIGTLLLGVALALLGLALALFAFRRWQKAPLSVPRRQPGPPRIAMGRLRRQRRTYDLPWEAVFDHWLILGRSRFGKSRHAAGSALQYLDSAQCGLVLIDPHDELCRSFVASAYRTLQQREVVWLSLGSGAFVPGLNLLQRLPGESPAAVAERFVALIDWLYFAGENVDHQKCTNNLRLAAWAVASVDGLLPDCRVFLTDSRYRRWLVRQTADQFLLGAIDEYNHNVGRDPTWHQSALNRLADILDNEALRRIVSQPTTFDLTVALDQPGVMLVSLDETHLGEKGVFLLAGILLYHLAGHLKRRAKDDDYHQNPKVRLILDEAQKFQVGILKGMIGELAGRGLALTLMTQGLSQFDDRQVASYVANNFSHYSVFAVSDQEAELLARQLFTQGANKLGVLDDRGRPAHFLAVQEQLAEAKRLLTQQLRREFVAKAYGKPALACESFELRPQATADELDAFRRLQLRRHGRPGQLVDRALQERMRALRGVQHDPEGPELVVGSPRANDWAQQQAPAHPQSGSPSEQATTGRPRKARSKLYQHPPPEANQARLWPEQTTPERPGPTGWPGESHGRPG